jgi:hypothetical protein
VATGGSQNQYFAAYEEGVEKLSWLGADQTMMEHAMDVDCNRSRYLSGCRHEMIGWRFAVKGVE